MTKALSALEKLKNQVAPAYQSTFDFATSEIEDHQIQEVVKKEEIIFKAFKAYSQNIFEICKELYDISLILKKDGNFMQWYQHIGLNKDKVSELLKRYELFRQVPEEYKLWVSFLSNAAVKLLTTKLTEAHLVHEVAQLGLKSTEEIKYWLSTSNILPLKENDHSQEVISPPDDELVEEFKELKNKIKLLKSSSNITQYKTQIKSIRREMEELEELIKQQENENMTKNNMKLFKEE